jgi:hypothetical protein
MRSFRPDPQGAVRGALGSVTKLRNYLVRSLGALERTRFLARGLMV